MKKKIVIGIIVCAVIAVAAVLLMLCKAPNLTMDGTYYADNGTTLTISGDTVTSNDAAYTGKLTRKAFSFAYLSNSKEMSMEYATLKNPEGIFEVLLRKENECFVTISKDFDDADAKMIYFYTK